MEFIYEAERIYVKNEAGRMAAEVTFHQRSDGAMSIDHTYVSPELRGRGVADRLLAAAAERFRRRGGFSGDRGTRGAACGGGPGREPGDRRGGPGGAGFYHHFAARSGIENP